MITNFDECVGQSGFKVWIEKLFKVKIVLSDVDYSCSRKKLKQVESKFNVLKLFTFPLSLRYLESNQTEYPRRYKI